LYIILKILNEGTWRTSVYYLAVSVSSFIFLLLVILAFKRELDERERERRGNIKNQIMSR
jgi:hypothetical protein